MSFFIYILLLVSTFTLIGLFLKGTNRIRYGEVFEASKIKAATDDEDALIDLDEDQNEDDGFDN